MIWEGMPELARRYMRRIEQDVAPRARDDRLLSAWIEAARACWCTHVERNPWGARQRNRAALEHLEALGDSFIVSFLRLLAATDEWMLGAFARAEELFPPVFTSPGAPHFVSSSVLRFRTMMLVERRKITEALEQAGSLLQLASTRDDFFFTVTARLLLSECRLLQGDLAGAEEEVRAAGAPARMPPFFRSVRLSLLAEIRLRQGRAAKAVELAREALALERSTAGFFVLRQEVVPVLLVEALHASGEVDAAREALREARAELLARADRIADPAYRRSFLENVTARARTMNLARAWLGA
ncbi:uncharacterized protein SOCE26_096060 [Sorangium cellulosum]|uniref:Uncharacterized protein n=1 Tax=Sorangium cellulosum TaxID=56 RepID=A0A2L0F911_SORCE|nr:hypothetical protein [Sorangium cellulosum]AUX48078.1 uncharacterized protein SOCE26_096060 [Sorangium cellulosum]